MYKFQRTFATFLNLSCTTLRNILEDGISKFLISLFKCIYCLKDEPVEILPTWYQHPAGMDWNLMSFFQGSFEIISCTCLHHYSFRYFLQLIPKRNLGGLFACRAGLKSLLAFVRIYAMLSLRNAPPDISNSDMSCKLAWLPLNYPDQCICCWISRNVWNGDYLVNSLFLYKVMIQEQEKYVINYNSMILFQLVQFFFDISVVFVCMQDPSSVGIK